MYLCRFFVVVTLLLIGAPASAAGAQPTVAQFEQVLNAHLQKLKPAGVTVRTVLFQNVRSGKPNGGYYPFEVTAIIHDYGPGYPRNGYYGQTCVGKMDKWKFDMRQDDFGDWIVQGRMTVSDAVCKDNPAEGVSATPVAGLSGQSAPNSPAPDAKPARQTGKNGASLYLGEYACYGAGGRLMAGMGFHFKAGGGHDDVDGGRGGTYVYDTSASTISFQGGFLDGQVGRNIRNTGFQLSLTIRCEPWR